MRVTETSSPTSRLHRVFVAAFLVTLLYVLLSQHLLPSGDHWGPRAGPFADLFAETETSSPATGFVAANRRLKQRLNDFERRLEEDSHLRAVTLSDVQLFLAGVGGVGNESVYLGQHDWLILRAGFDYLTGPPFLDPSGLERRRRAAPAWQPAPRPDPRPAILDLHRQLAARGIRLLLLPAPTKPMIHPESLLTGLAESAATTGLQNPSFRAFRAELEAHGALIFDPAPTLLENLRETGREQYLRTDSHWTPGAVDAVARDLAERIRSIELPWAGTPVTWRRQSTTLSGVGDLERSLMLPGGQELFTPQAVELQQVRTRRGRPWRPDPRAEILILGDSFTNVFSDPGTNWGTGAGLAEQLSFHLKRPVDRVAINAGGVAATRRRLVQDLAAGRDRLVGKKVVIWQFAIRTLAVGDWELVDLGSVR
ncbi:MAG: hypothetical protein GY719_41880 [bacterium]|nr:hypothetical protein [bacterium]